jgi:hypothetical protein
MTTPTGLWRDLSLEIGLTIAPWSPVSGSSLAKPEPAMETRDEPPR